MNDPVIKVLEERFKGLEDLFNEKFKSNDECHERVLEQVTKTNGRVSALESWKNKAIGALVALGAIGSAQVAVLLKGLFK